jgi:ABC-type nickel/cobalt efflux system permease component RcnA
MFERTDWLVIVVAACLGAPTAASAHPMGNFAICHYTHLRAERDVIRIRYILDFAELPTLDEKQVLDRNGDGIVSADERAAYLTAKTLPLLAGLTLHVNDRFVSFQPVAGDVQLSAGAGGLDTLKITLDLKAPLSPSEAPSVVVFRDQNYATRAGWKEIVARAGPGVAIRDASVPCVDCSRELTEYPPDTVPPQVTQARFLVQPQDSSSAREPVQPLDPLPDTGLANTPCNTTPRDAFTQAIASRELSPGLILIGLVIAFVFGALHALSPGHGKAMVAAYLAGSRGTAGHAALLGVLVTITHTLGVFVLGLVALFASHYMLPEKLYPILSGLSGAAVCSVGVWLLYRRVRRILRNYRRQQLAHSAPPQLGRTKVSPPSSPRPSHHDLPPGPVTARTLLALGISGGLVPCPSALVVLLAAVALHRITYGLLLILAFSAGLASVLVVIGLLIVYARSWLDRLPYGGTLLRRLPIASSLAITLIGVVLVLRAFGQGMP